MHKNKFTYKHHQNYPFNSIDTRIRPIKNILPILKDQTPVYNCMKSQKFQEVSFSKTKLKPPTLPNNLIELGASDSKFEILSTMMIKLITEADLNKNQFQIYTHKVTTNFYVFVKQVDEEGFTIISNCCKLHAYFLFITMSQKFYIFCSKCNKELYSELKRSKSSSSIVRIKPQQSFFNFKVSSMIQSGKYKKQKLQSLCYMDDDNDNDDLKSIIDKIY